MKVSSPQDAKIIVQKLSSDIGIHRNPRKGTLDAPEKILEDYNFSKNVLVDEVFPDEFSLENTHRRIEANTEELTEYRKPLLSLGGDHSVSYPVIQALKRKNPGMKLVWLDAHLDLKDKVKNHVSHDVVVRELLKRGFSRDEVYFVGITEIDHDEKMFIENQDFTIYGPEEIEDFLQEFNKNEQSVYLSVDIDVLDQKEAPGTGYPDGKLSLNTVKQVINKIEPDHADLVEVAPSLDTKSKTVDNSRKIVSELEKILGE